MKRAHRSTLGGAIALLVVAAANAEAPSSGGTDTARVESAGTDGGLPTRTVDVQSAEYDATQRPETPSPGAASRLPLLVAAGAGALAIGLFFGLRNRQRAPRT